MKNILHRAIIWLKIEICLKIEDTSFKLNLVTFTLITMIYFLIWCKKLDVSGGSSPNFNFNAKQI